MLCHALVAVLTFVEEPIITGHGEAGRECFLTASYEEGALCLL